MTGASTEPAGQRPDHDWDEAYSGSGPLPWDTGRPQPMFVALADAGQLRGRVLDAGCGTGEHALMVAARGMDATGVDISGRAIGIAQRKAEDRGLSVRFIAMDALQLGELDEVFDTVLDSGLFHCFTDEQRDQYVSSLGDVSRPGTHLFLACFSDQEPGDWGPRRVRGDELRASFANGWTIDSIQAAEFDITIAPSTARAWLMTATRV